jgi:ubiquinone/menaquinone biosynthesis C-methylase UbiE
MYTLRHAWCRTAPSTLQRIRREHSNAHFGTSEFWSAFYQKKRDRFEWFLSTPVAVCEFEQELGDVRGAILHVGCGTSDLGYELWSQTPGCTSVVNVDYSPEAIAIAQRQHDERRLAAPSERHAMSFVQADCRALSDAWRDRFALIVDKGTLDAVQLAGSVDCQQFLDEMRRVAQPGGKLLSLTDDMPEQRLELLRRCLPDCAHSFREVEAREDESWTYFVYKSVFPLR